MASFSLAKGFDRAGLARIADALVVTIAVSLPWSTSVTAILLVLWLIIELPTLDWADVRRAVMTPAGWLPVLLVALGPVGMMWADVPFAQRVRGFDSFLSPAGRTGRLLPCTDVDTPSQRGHFGAVSGLYPGSVRTNQRKSCRPICNFGRRSLSSHYNQSPPHAAMACATYQFGCDRRDIRTDHLALCRRLPVW